MKILVPIDTTVLTFTTVPENDAPAWAVGTTYNIEDAVVYNHGVYKSIADANIGHVPETSTDHWLLMGKTNAYKCLDDKVNTQTTAETTIIMEFPTLKATSICFLNVECRALKVEIIKPDGNILFSETKEGVHRDVTGWFSFYTADFAYVNAFLFEHPYALTSKYRVTLTGTVCKLGVVTKGISYEIGQTLWGFSKGFYDYSKKEENEWGEIFLQEGNSRDYFRGEVFVKTPMLDIVTNILKKRKGKLTMFIPTTLSDSTIYGFIREPEVIWRNPTGSILTLDIEGVV